MKPTLWGTGTTRTFRAHLALIERAVDYRCIPIRTRTDDQDRSDFRAISVSRKIPVYQDDNVTLSESAAIARYIMTRDQPARGAVEQAICDQWCFFIMTELDATALYVLRRHADLHEIYGKAEMAVEAAVSYFDRQINALSDRLLDGRLYLLGDSFSELDILLISVLDWARILKMPIPNAAVEYRQSIRDRESYRRAFELNYSQRQ